MRHLELRLPDDLADALDRIAGAQERSRNATIVVAIRQYIRREEARILAHPSKEGRKQKEE